MSRAPQQPLLITSGLALLGLAACVSLATGVHHALLCGSHDLQWAGARLLAHHTDPWAEALASSAHTPAHFSPPNYLHLLYLLLLPFSALPFRAAEWLWCALSIALSIATILVLARLFALSRSQALLVLFLLWMSAPFRVVLEVGQMSLVELFLLTLTFTARSSRSAGAAFGVSLMKYSFSPVPALLLLLRRRYTVLLFAVGICALAVLACRIFLTTPILHLAGEPFQVAHRAVDPGLADLMTFAEYSLRPLLGVTRAKTLSYALALSASAAYAVLLSRFRLSKAVDLTLVSLASLLFFKHLDYDFVFLAIPLCYALSLKDLRTKAPILLGVLIFWFLTAALGASITDFTIRPWPFALNLLLLAAVLCHTTTVAIRNPSTPRTSTQR